jgi:hypothetical protein
MLTILFRSHMIADLRFDRRHVRCQDADFVHRVCMRGAVGYTTELLAEVWRYGRSATCGVGMMALDKLRALEYAGEDPLATNWRDQRNARLLRARFDAAVALLRRKRWDEARQKFKSAPMSRGSIVRKLKGAIRLEIFGQNRGVT